MKKNFKEFKVKSGKFTAATLAAITLAASTLTGCAGISSLGTAHAESGLKNQYEGSKINTVAITDFDKTLAEFVEKSGFADENYMVSPTSFRAALALAIAGADSETKDELIHAMGFENMDEVNAWYYSVEKIVDDFDTNIENRKKSFKENRDMYGEDDKEPDGSLLMMNSIWKNTAFPGEFGKEYAEYVEKNYSAEAKSVSADKITKEVNEWVNKGTNGLIKEISGDLSNTDTILINTLYLKSSWTKNFRKVNNTVEDFTTKSGEEVAKEFMNNTDDYRFYSDKKGKLVVLPMNGGVNAVFVLGEIKDIHEALEKATMEEVTVKLPKFELESSFDNKEFVNFLTSRGAEKAFGGEADFSVMCKDYPLKISDIVQKTKIKIDEDGLEAAAVTAMCLDAACAMVEEEPKEFIANEPFKFYICGGQNDQEILFSGQIVK